MESWVIILGICGIYLLITLVMGIVPGLKVSHSTTGYVAGDRSMNVLILYFVLGASIFSSFAFLGGPGWAYSRGAAALYIIAYGAIGMVPFYFFGPKARALGEKYGFVTQAELLEDRYNSKLLSGLLAILTVVVLIPYLTLQMKGAGLVLNTISEGAIPTWMGAGIAYFVVLIYVFYSGVMGVGWTNTFQGIFMLVIAWFLGIYLPEKMYGGIGPMFEQLINSEFKQALTAPGLTSGGEPWDWWGFSSAVIVSAIGFSMWPHFFMKAFAAKSDRTIKLTVVLYPTFQVFLVPILIIGFSAVLAFPGVTPADSILPHVLLQMDLPVVLIGLVCAGTLAASMSSGDAIVHAAASVGVRDGLTKIPAVNSWLKSGDHERLLIRISVVIISLIAYYFAVFSETDIVSLLLGAYGGIAQMFPLVFAMFYWPRATGKGALAGLIGGILVTLFFLYNPEFKPVPMHEGIYGLIVNVVLLAGVSLRTKAEEVERIKRYNNL
ncbi:MAG: sodium:solute symporter family protein [Balneolaceae bacterium]|nr:sodium:solute symporter family protein [Balneolaceae bacterium]MBO6547057.1 sodium:solute symporter family protein [Balneolaceae bacterium]MBO6647996.1 sodium:solute symporter family protein [Balneolaceae bacterium]